MVELTQILRGWDFYQLIKINIGSSIIFAPRDIFFLLWGKGEVYPNDKSLSFLII